MRQASAKQDPKMHDGWMSILAWPRTQKSGVTVFKITVHIINHITKHFIITFRY
jgi:hypothetical protein